MGTVGLKSLDRSLCIGIIGPKSFRMSVSVVAVQSGPLDHNLTSQFLLLQPFKWVPLPTLPTITFGSRIFVLIHYTRLKNI